MMRRILSVLAAVSVTLPLVAGCSGNDDGAAATTTTEATTTTTTDVAPISVVVTNDDGIDAPGVDALVEALRGLDGIEIAVVAPAENQSGSSDRTTEGEVDFTDGTTASGMEGTAVAGLPADAVGVALGPLGLTPDLIVSGVNEGQNVGPFAAISGTVGAARTAIRRGIPAVASSVGVGEWADFGYGAQLVVDWIEEHREGIADGTLTTRTLVSFNVPGCTAGEVAGLIDVPLASEIPEGVSVFETDCTTAPEEPPANDVLAVARGYASQTEVPADLPG